MLIEGRIPRVDFVPEKAILQLRYVDGKYHIRIDDPRVPSLWLEVIITQQELDDERNRSKEQKANE